MAAPSKGKHIRRDCRICSSIVVIPPVMMMRMMIKFVKNKKAVPHERGMVHQNLVISPQPNYDGKDSRAR